MRYLVYWILFKDFRVRMHYVNTGMAIRRALGSVSVVMLDWHYSVRKRTLKCFISDQLTELEIFVSEANAPYTDLWNEFKGIKQSEGTDEPGGSDTGNIHATFEGGRDLVIKTVLGEAWADGLPYLLRYASLGAYRYITGTLPAIHAAELRRAGFTTYAKGGEVEFEMEVPRILFRRLQGKIVMRSSEWIKRPLLRRWHRKHNRAPDIIEVADAVNC